MKLTIQEFKQVVKDFALANLRIPILVTSHMGAGKSQAVQQVAKELNMLYMDLRLATQEAGDLTGIPRAVDMKTFWCQPDWIPPKDAKFMLVLEELNRAPADVLQAIFQALTENKIHTHPLPDHTMIVACINPADAMYHVTDLDPAMQNRFWHCEIEPDKDDWMKWMYEEKADERVIKFIGAHSDLFYVPKERGACPTPRTLKLLSDAMLGTNPNDAGIMRLAVGFIGQEAGVAFANYCRKDYDKPVSGKEILTEYIKIKPKFDKQQADAINVTANDLIAMLGAGKFKMNKTHMTNLVAFLKDLKPEWKSKIIPNLPNNLMNELSNDESLVEEIQNILNSVRQAQAKPQP